MDLNELNQLDLNNFGEWPVQVKVIAILIVCIALGAAAYYYDTKPLLEELASQQQNEQELRKTFEVKQQKAANLQAYRDQLAKMQELFGAMLKQLPNKAEVAALLIDVSQTGLANGLEFERFEPQNELTQEFYVELPIIIRVRGQYHDFGRFVSGLAALPRIVTIHNIQILGGNEKGNPERLAMQATLKTYRYQEEGGK
ncbi:type 4a pilus biogenesis protein PilO [Caldichromatium japonicum]|uniref:Type 4a pilus biogenesis protein PilO n=1 Tax=Caldichromatium japonicum TaxID=2699430 RepID=A0A6G7V9D8_9GAMM|nr:type 4a pilus biogenesis protein PilO [Caldichromatium japonicum]QIK36683.1 type 4a pilus biogenesis protein PilO [Caldichromatium japonicum]